MDDFVAADISAVTSHSAALPLNAKNTQQRSFSMRNINKFLKLISTILAILMLASFAGCGDANHDDHEGHDHAIEDAAAIASMYPDVNLLTFPSAYPDVRAYDVKEVKKELHSTGVVMLRVVKIEDGQYYCTAGKSQIPNYILLDPPFDEVQVDDYLLLNANTYLITSERFGFDYGKVFSSLYVFFGNESTVMQKITAAEAYQIYSQVPSIE